MARWLKYLNERSPFVPTLILSAGIAASGQAIAGHWVPTGLVLETVLLIVVFVLLRLMDEVKDLAKDRIAHPERPLPRGLLTVREVERAIFLLMGALFLTAAGLASAGATLAGVLLAVSLVYLWLMYREFYIGKSLARQPFLYAATHQVIILPLYAIPSAIHSPGLIFDRRLLVYLFSNLFASFLYEVGRKLDPEAHPILGTYRSMYGTATTFSFMIMLVALAAWVVSNGAARVLLWTVDALVLLTIILAWQKKKAFKAVEGSAMLSCLIHLWAPVVATLL
jgi:4-hydroxybenzoate polyprenyltransferase